MATDDYMCRIAECGKKIRARGLCQTHYKRWQRWGSPFYVSEQDSPETRFWEAVDVSGDCWEWRGSTRGHGYGALRVNGRTTSAHRFSYELAYGPIPDGLFVCHHCDNPPCVNPAHLFIGTCKDNTRDMLSKGRGNRPKGVRISRAKLTEDDVRYIRRMRGEIGQKELAERFGVSQGNISSIQLKRIWEHVGD